MRKKLESSLFRFSFSLILAQVEELKRDVAISQAESEKQRRLCEESQAQVESFAPERDLLQSKIQVRVPRAVTEG